MLTVHPIWKRLSPAACPTPCFYLTAKRFSRLRLSQRGYLTLPKDITVPFNSTTRFISLLERLAPDIDTQCEMISTQSPLLIPKSGVNNTVKVCLDSSKSLRDSAIELGAEGVEPQNLCVCLTAYYEDLNHADLVVGKLLRIELNGVVFSTRWISFDEP
jgi:hypothetical protein